MSSTSSSKRKGHPIRVVVNESNVQLNPIVCSFPCGLPEISKTSPKFKWHGDNVVGKDETCYYHASFSQTTPEDDMDATTTAATQQATTVASSAPVPIKQSSKLCVGVYDTVTGQLTIYPAACQGRVFALEQQVYNTKNSMDATKNKSINALINPKGALAQYNALFDDFGSAKKRKVLKSRLANKVEDVVGTGVMATDIDNTGTAIMSESNRLALAEQRAARDAADAAGSTERVAPSDGVDAAMEIMRRTFLPTFHRQAEQPNQVYDWQDVAGPAGWEYLDGVVQKHYPNTQRNIIQALTETNDDAKSDSFNSAVRQLLDKYPEDCQSWTGEKARSVVYKLKCALLLNHWLHLWNKLNRRKFISKSSSMQAGKYFYHQPVVLGLRFLERFTTPMVDDRTNNEGYVFTQANRDSCLVHLILLYMRVDFVQSAGDAWLTSMSTTDLYPLAQDLRMDVADVLKLLRQAGCTVVKKKDKIGAILNTPLTFPKAKKMSGTKR